MSDRSTRRALLRASLLAAGATGLAGCGGSSPPQSTDTPIAPRPEAGTPDVELPPEWHGFDDVVDLARGDGDPSGRRPIDGPLGRAVADGTLVYLRPGRYRLSEEFTFDEFEQFGLVGRDATIVPDEGFDGTLLELGGIGSAGRLLVDGLSFDFRAEETGGRPVVAQVDDRLVLRDLTVRGRQDVHNDTVRVDVGSPEGSGLVERLQLPDGGFAESWDGDSGVTGCEVGSENRGDLTFADCRIEGFPDNGLYANPPEGVVRVLGGYYANSGVANVRVNAAAGSVVRGVHVRCDSSPEGFENMRGIRLRGGEAPLVEDCLVEMVEVSSSDGGITVHSDLPSVTIRNCRITTEAEGVPGVRVKSPSSGTAADGPVVIDRLQVSGGAEGLAAIDLADREACSLRGLCLHQTGPDRDGIRTANVEGELVDARIAVSGRPLAFSNSDIETSRLSITSDLGTVSNDYCGQSA